MRARLTSVHAPSRQAQSQASSSRGNEQPGGEPTSRPLPSPSTQSRPTRPSLSSAHSWFAAGSAQSVESVERVNSSLSKRRPSIDSQGSRKRIREGSEVVPEDPSLYHWISDLPYIQDPEELNRPPSTLSRRTAPTSEPELPSSHWSDHYTIDSSSDNRLADFGAFTGPSSTAGLQRQVQELMREQVKQREYYEQELAKQRREYLGVINILRQELQTERLELERERRERRIMQDKWFERI